MPPPDVSALFDLSDRAALVTGGSRGLGLDAAVALCEAGATVALASRRATWLRSAAEHIRQRGFTCLTLEVDVADPAQAARAVDHTVETFGSLDILVNNAGVSWGAPAVNLPLDKWNEVLSTNVTGSFLMAREALRVMGGRGGSIINVASVAGLVGSPPEVLDATGYAASKGAVIALTRDLAVKWARHGVRVNALAPGFFDTRMSHAVIERSATAITQRTPMGRIGRPGEIGGAVVFLAADASRYVTGHVLAVDGGMLAW